MRARHRRTIAEALHLLCGRPALGARERDILAIVVFSLRAIYAGVEQSASAWDRRHYYLKAEGLRRDWAWTKRYGDRLTRLLVSGDWVEVPRVLAELAVRFADIRVTKVTRSESFWTGAYDRLLADGRAGDDSGGQGGST